VSHTVVTDSSASPITDADILSLVDRSPEEIGTPASVARWAVDGLHLDQAQADVLGLHRQEVVDLHVAMRAILDAVVDGRSPNLRYLETLNELAARRPTVPELVLVADRPRAATRVLASGGGTVVAAMAAAAIALLGGPDRERIRRCPARACGRFFLAERSSQRWCSGACGNRTRVARHHDRVRATGRSGGAA
jgi:predicted RNA-binding Zn ribbon-like protein